MYDNYLYKCVNIRDMNKMVLMELCNVLLPIIIGNVSVPNV